MRGMPSGVGLRMEISKPGEEGSDAALVNICKSHPHLARACALVFGREHGSGQSKYGGFINQHLRDLIRRLAKWMF